MNNSLVYIIVLNYNNWQDTLMCLKSLKKLDYQYHKIILVDNASTDNSCEKINNWQTQNNLLNLVFLLSDKNGGYSAGNNIGLRYVLSQSDVSFVWLLNNDVEVESSSLSYLVNDYNKKSNESNKIGILGSKIMDFHQRKIIQAAGGGTLNTWIAYSWLIGAHQEDKGQFDVEKIKLDFILGVSMFCPIAFIKDVGLLNEDYFLYLEEPDWAERAKKKNWQLAYCYQSKVYHKGGATTGGEHYGTETSSSDFSDFHFHKSRILFTKKFYPYKLPVFYATFVVVIFNRLIRKQYHRIPNILALLFNPKRGYK